MNKEVFCVHEKKRTVERFVECMLMSGKSFPTLESKKDIAKQASDLADALWSEAETRGWIVKEE